jgi:hypothetical protein
LRISRLVAFVDILFTSYRQNLSGLELLYHHRIPIAKGKIRNDRFQNPNPVGGGEGMNLLPLFGVSMRGEGVPV